AIGAANPERARTDQQSAVRGRRFRNFFQSCRIRRTGPDGDCAHEHRVEYFPRPIYAGPSWMFRTSNYPVGRTSPEPYWTSRLSIAGPEPQALFARTVDDLGMTLGFLARKNARQPQADGALVADVEPQLHELFAADFGLHELALVQEFDRDFVAERGHEPDDRRTRQNGVALGCRPENDVVRPHEGDTRPLGGSRIHGQDFVAELGATVLDRARERVGAAEEIEDEGRARVLVDVPRRADLLDNAAVH